jgi:hypothetical protein
LRISLSLNHHFADSRVNVYWNVPSNKNSLGGRVGEVQNYKIRNYKMKRVVGATFLFFYTTFTVVAISEHTASWASTIALHSPSNTKTVRAASPHASQVRIQEDPFIGFLVKAGFAPGDTVSTSVHPSLLHFEGDSLRFTPSRAPPLFL